GRDAEEQAAAVTAVLLAVGDVDDLVGLVSVAGPAANTVVSFDVLDAALDVLRVDVTPLAGPSLVSGPPDLVLDPGHRLVGRQHPRLADRRVGVAVARLSCTGTE